MVVFYLPSCLHSLVEAGASVGELLQMRDCLRNASLKCGGENRQVLPPKRNWLPLQDSDTAHVHYKQEFSNNSSAVAAGKELSKGTEGEQQDDECTESEDSDHFDLSHLETPNESPMLSARSDATALSNEVLCKRNSIFSSLPLSRILSLPLSPALYL